MFFKTLSVCFLLYLLSNFSHGQRGNVFFRRGYIYLDATGSFYKIHTTYQTWAGAKQFCAQEGASLFYPDNDHEARAVISFWTRTQPQIRLVNVGLSDIKVEGHFETIHGKQIAEVYNNWQPGEPNNMNDNEDCVVLFQNGYINDGTCHTKEAFICKKSLLGEKCLREDYSYIDAVESFYKIHTAHQTWADAKQECDLEGASLFYPDNDDEARAVISFWIRKQPQIQLVNVGLSDIKVEGHFETIDGKQVAEVYNNWQPGEPNNQNGNEDCVVMFQNGYINDGTCHTTEAFICKKSLTSLQRNCNMQNLDGKRFREDYSYIDAAGSFYKIHTAYQTWADAKQTCAQEDARLFYPDNDNEARAVISFWTRTQPQIPLVNVGLSDIKVEGHFETIDGKQVAEVYNNWQPGEPNNMNGNEDCVVLFQNGYINDGTCHTTEAFICKKSLTSLQRNCNMQNLDGNGFRDDYNYIDAGRSFYKIHTAYQTWADAKQACAQEGARLFYPDNDNEARAVISFWTRTQPQIPLVNVGLSDIKIEGYFETIDGKQVAEVYNNWQPGEPNNMNGNEDCVVLFQNGYINDGTCHTTEAFICKKSLPSLQRNCNMQNLDGRRQKKFFREDYNYIEAVESFYKIHSTRQEWSDAKQTCALEGASLFFPENSDETHAVLSFWNSTQPHMSSVYVGITDVKYEGLFETIDGKPISEVYNNWKSGQPNNAGGKQDCVLLYQQGDMNDIRCETKHRFICKKSLLSLECATSVRVYEE